MDERLREQQNPLRGECGGLEVDAKEPRRAPMSSHAKTESAPVVKSPFGKAPGTASALQPQICFTFGLKLSTYLSS